MAPSEYWADSVLRLLAPRLSHPLNTGLTVSTDCWPLDYGTLRILGGLCPQTIGPPKIAPSEYWADSVHRLLPPGLWHPQNTGRTLSSDYWPPDYRTLRRLGGLCPQATGPRTMAPSEYWADSVLRLLAPRLSHPLNTGLTLSSDYWPPDYGTLRILGGLCPQTIGPPTIAPSEYWADSVHRLLAPGLWHPQNTGRTLSSDYWLPDYRTL